MNPFRKRPHYDLLEMINTELAIYTLPLLARSKLPPNQITVPHDANGRLILPLTTAHYLAELLLRLAELWIRNASARKGGAD